ncbi:hypothetical protein, conserved [Leishmania donovani]|nr:hypothetical protein, conserved [Leishmania donovani]AYU83187.1 hypothetical protein LdCL_350043700 [Leishmania donovani]CBZ38285.1 hypothetical protein, conserved [Leishmania donovani]
MAETTMTAERQMAGIKSRERLRRDQERQLRQLPFLYHRVKDLHDTCERLEQELASSHQRVAAFQQEAFALRSLIKFTEHPELAAAAKDDAAKHVLQEEVRELRNQVQRLQREKELSLRQSEEACEAAEFYKELCDQLYEESLRAAEAIAVDGATSGLECIVTPLPNGNIDGATLSASTAPSTATSMEAQMRQLHGALEFERARSSALEETVSLLHTAMKATTAADTKRSTPAPDSSAGWAERRRGDDTSAVYASRSHVFADDTRKSRTRLKRLVAVLRIENRLLTQRVSEVVARNMRCVKDISALKLANKRLELNQRQES